MININYKTTDLIILPCPESKSEEFYKTLHLSLVGILKEIGDIGEFLVSF